MLGAQERFPCDTGQAKGKGKLQLLVKPCWCLSAERVNRDDFFFTSGSLKANDFTVNGVLDAFVSQYTHVLCEKSLQYRTIRIELKNIFKLFLFMGGERICQCNGTKAISTRHRVPSDKTCHHTNFQEHSEVSSFDKKKTFFSEIKGPAYTVFTFKVFLSSDKPTNLQRII